MSNSLSTTGASSIAAKAGGEAGGGVGNWIRFGIEDWSWRDARPDLRLIPWDNAIADDTCMLDPPPRNRMSKGEPHRRNNSHLGMRNERLDAIFQFDGQCRKRNVPHHAIGHDNQFLHRRWIER